MACPVVWPPGAVLPGIPEPASIGSLGRGATSTEGQDPGPDLLNNSHLRMGCTNNPLSLFVSPLAL